MYILITTVKGVYLRATFVYYHFMMSVSSRNPNLFDRRANYRIIVYDRIDPTWSDRLEGMMIYETIDENEAKLTTLEGELSDQAPLAGVLNSLLSYIWSYFP